MLERRSTSLQGVRDGAGKKGKVVCDCIVATAAAMAAPSMTNSTLH